MPLQMSSIMSQEPVNHKELQAILEVWVAQHPTLKPYWHNDIHASKCLTIIGDAGGGKSTAIKKMCKRLKMEFRRMPTGSSLEEDNLGIPDPTAPKTAEGHFGIRMPPWYPCEPPRSESGLGVYFIDEIFTANEMQQNQIAILLTDGYHTGLSGVPVAPCWIFIAATNPPSERYYLSKDPDERLLARLWPIRLEPTAEESMYYFSENDVMPDVLYQFLLQNPDYLTYTEYEGKDKRKPIWRVDNRTWEDVGTFLQRALEMKLDLGLVSRMLSTRVGEPVTHAFMAYLEHGDDPLFYPIPAKRLIAATSEEHARHMEIIKKWCSLGHERQATMGLTCHDMVKWLSDPDFKLSDKGAENIADVLQIVPADLASVIMDASADKPAEEKIFSRISGTGVAKKLYEMDKERTESARRPRRKGGS